MAQGPAAPGRGGNRRAWLRLPHFFRPAPGPLINNEAVKGVIRTPYSREAVAASGANGAPFVIEALLAVALPISRAMLPHLFKVARLPGEAGRI